MIVFCDMFFQLPIIICTLCAFDNLCSASTRKFKTFRKKIRFLKFMHNTNCISIALLLFLIKVSSDET